MKFDQVKDVVAKAVSETLGDTYMSESGLLQATESYRIADVGVAIANAGSTEQFTKALISRLAYLELIEPSFDNSIKSLEVSNFEWGGFVERAYFEPTEMFDDPMINLVNGQSYAAIEHTAYIPSVKAKIFEEGKAMCFPISIQEDTLKEAFRDWSELNRYVSGLRASVATAIKVAKYSMQKMLVSCGCAVSIASEGLNNAVHFITNAKADGIVPNTVTYYADIIALGPVAHRAFLVYCAKTIANTLDQLEEYSDAYNNGNLPTADTAKLLLISKFAKDFRFNMEASTFNDDKLGFGDYEEIVSWQAIKENGKDPFDFDTITSVSIDADSNNKLGIGTSAFSQSGIVGLAWQNKAIGMCLDRVKMTSNYTACAAFWNEFTHILINYLLDTNLGIVAFVLD